MKQQKIAALIVIFGCFIAYALYITKPMVKRTSEKPSVPLVAIRSFPIADYPSTYKGVGQVVPARSILLRSEIVGVVKQVSHDFHKGALVSQGDILVQLGDQVYRDQVAKAQANLDKMQALHTIEEGKRAVAQAGINTIVAATGMEPTNSALMQRQPHLKQTFAAQQAAEVDVSIAERNLRKTQIASPFNAMIVDASVHVGSVVAAGTQLTRLIDTDNYWVQLQLPAYMLSWFTPGDANQYHADITSMHGAKPVQGKVHRVIQQLDTKSRMGQLVIVVADPLQLHSQASSSVPGQTPLLMGDYVDVEVYGKILTKVTQLPRSVVHADNQIWLYNDGKLHIESIEPIFEDISYVYVKNLKITDHVITSPMVAPVDGMTIALAE